jgi:hypothetical protein
MVLGHVPFFFISHFCLKRHKEKLSKKNLAPNPFEIFVQIVQSIDFGGLNLITQPF